MQLQSIDTHLVVALHALLQEQNVTRAAQRIGVTQPSMSHALSRLRAHFADPLLVRVGREMTLSERARELLSKTAEAIERLERVFGPSEQFDPKKSRRTFRLVATDNLELLVFPTLARVLAEEAPHINIRCRNIPAGWEELLRSGDLDAKLGRGGPVPEGCRSLPLAQERFVCVMRQRHPAAGKRLTPGLYAALDHLAVSPHGEERNYVDQLLEEQRLQRRVAMTVSHFLVAPFIVAESDLVLTISERVARTLARTLGLLVRPCPVIPVGYSLTLVWPARLEADAGHRWLRTAISRNVTK